MQLILCADWLASNHLRRHWSNKLNPRTKGLPNFNLNWRHCRLFAESIMCHLSHNICLKTCILATSLQPYSWCFLMSLFLVRNQNNIIVFVFVPKYLCSRKCLGSRNLHLQMYPLVFNDISNNIETNCLLCLPLHSVHQQVCLCVSCGYLHWWTAHRECWVVL